MKKILFDTKINHRNSVLSKKIISLIKKYKSSNRSSLLELGIGNGRWGILIGKKFKEYYGIEPDKDYLKIAEKSKPSPKFIYKLGKAENIPFNKKFDVIFLAFSWHFINDFKKALKEMDRVLKKDGIILIMEPSIKTKNWASPKLNKGSQEFDPLAYKKKLFSLERGVKEIEFQKFFDIKEKGLGKINYWILRKK